VDFSEAIALAVAAAGAATLGSMLGLGGGVFMVPLFTLFIGIDEKAAIGASAVAVVLNSVVGSSVHLRSRFTNIRLAMLLQVTTAAGALVGALFAVRAPAGILNGVFGAVLVYAAVSMLMKRKQAPPIEEEIDDPWRLRSHYVDPATNESITYTPINVPKGLGVSGFAGVISGMLGVGGGVIQVPAMNLLMRIPVKAAAGTSAFMVGITAVATSFVFYAEEELDPTVVTPALIGIFLGSQLGSRLTRRVRAQRLVMIFVVVLLYLGLSLIFRALGVTLPGQK
jgi:uncharacterized protein